MTQINRGDTVYELGPCLGKGGFGVCYKAVERNQRGASSTSERVVAVKKISQKMIAKAAKEPYLRYEIALHSKLRHLNVTELYATFSTGDSIYFVLEYCNKKSLADILVRVTTLPMDLAANYFNQMVCGLRYIHECQILHRDLKLSNILVDANEVVKISDFGLSCTVTRGYLERHLACGTPNYLSPEVLLRQGHTVKSDVWSCGVVLYAMFGGIPPFQADDLAEIYGNIVTGSYHFTQYHCDDHMKDLIARMLKLDPEERPDLEEVLIHEFTRYGDQYESQPSKDDDKVSTTCVNLAKNSSVRKSLSRSLTNLLAKSSIESEKKQQNHRTNGHCIPRSHVPRSITVVDVKLLRISNLLEHFRSRPAWNKRATEFQSSWLTWWRDKTATVAFYYQFSTDYNCALFNDATCCLHNTGTGCAYFVNIRSAQHMHREAVAKLEAVNKFYEPMLRDVLEEFQDVSPSNQVREQVSWVSQSARATTQEAVPYLTSWSAHGTCHAFYMSDGSVQVNFGDAFLLRVCGRLCYFYQPARRGFLIETRSLDAWCFQEVNAQLVDVLCEIFLPQYPQKA